MKTLQNMGWDKKNGAWEFLIVETNETFHVEIFAVLPGHLYEVFGRVYRKA